MAKARKRRKKANPVPGHARKVTKGRRKCKKCGRPHSTSAHWSHAANSGAKSFRAKRGTGKRKGKKTVARGFTRGGTKFGPVMSSAETPAYKKARKARKARRKSAAAQKSRGDYAARAFAASKVKPMSRAERSKRNKARHKAKQVRVKPHLAKNAGRKPGSHRVAGHLRDIRPKRRKRLG